MGKPYVHGFGNGGQRTVVPPDLKINDRVDMIIHSTYMYGHMVRSQCEQTNRQHTPRQYGNIIARQHLLLTKDYVPTYLPTYDLVVLY